MPLPAQAGDWTRFRGPNGSGIAEDEAPMPVHWNESANIKWKIELPGQGSSCPIVVGDRVFVTSWSGYGETKEEPGEQANLVRHLSCIDRKTGDIVWTKDVKPFLPEDEYEGMFAEHGYATHTPASDGENVYVFFGKTGGLAFDMEGNQLWQTSAGTGSGAKRWGSSSSPILFEDLVILTASAESESLVALDKATGNEVWRQEADGLNSLWGTPILVKVDDTRTDLVVAVPGEIWGVNPRTGKLRWFCEGHANDSFCSSPVAADGVVYAIESGRRGGGGIAVRVGGTGDVTESHIVWKGSQAGRIGAPVLNDGRLYTVARGVAGCFEAETGDEVYRKRLQAVRSSGGGGRGGRGGGQDYASPVMADGKIYFTSRGGAVHVFEEGPEFKQLAVNKMTDEVEDFSSTPAVSDGELFLRSSKHLYCVAKLEDVEPEVEITESESVTATEEQEPRRGGGGNRFDPAAFFDRLDANGDGKLAGDEFTGRFAERAKGFDSDGDDEVSKEEFQAGMQAMGPGGGRGGRGGAGGNGGGNGGDGGRGGDGGGGEAGSSSGSQRPESEG